jgi:asparagine synthase (glutamine-hydrolysing)
MCDTLVHRGPDDQGIDVAAGVGIGMRRLSIIDLSGGHQPIFNEDRTVRTVFNGEIYNFRELREQLETRGHRFATASDTEVLVHGYEEWGSELPSRLNGMFAFAIHDLRKGRLLLARDHLGIKPLFYAVTPDHLVWGSELKAVLASGLLERRVDTDALAELLTWEYVPGSGTLLRSVRKLEAGHLLEVDLQAPACTDKMYWDVPLSSPEEEKRSGEEWLEEVEAKLQQAVTRQLVSDVPLGAFLSGGVDSSLMVSFMGDARTFSIGFDDASYNELPWAQRVADHLGLSHRSEVIRPDVLDLFHQLMEFMDDPIGDFSIFPTYLVSRLAREEVKVALSGDGGDELFAGYETYQAQRLAKVWAKLPRWASSSFGALGRALPPTEQKKGVVNKVKRLAEGFEHPESLRHARWRIFLGAALRETLFTREAQEQMTGEPLRHMQDALERGAPLGELNSGLYADVKTYLCDNILVKVDRMSMATSLETRVPYLDREFVELAFRVPEDLKLSRRGTKLLLKRLAAQRVPRDCIYRAKQGFSIPIKNWLKTRFRDLMEDLLEPRRLEAQGLLDSATIERLKAEHLSNAANHSHLLWSAMVFQAWHARWMEGGVPAAPPIPR